MRVTRDELLDYETYGERRAKIREEIMAIKKDRRIHVGDYLTFLFENADTMRYQIQEMMRAERIVKEESIQHELTTYNELLGRPGELGCSLLIEIADAAERPEKLREWVGLQEHVYVLLEDGSRVRATFDPRQVDDDRLSSVQYLKFPVEDGTPVAVGSDFPTLAMQTMLSPSQKAALLEDLKR